MRANSAGHPRRKPLRTAWGQMKKTLQARLEAAEKASAGDGTRWGYTLEQLVLASRGEDVGPPRKRLRDDEPSLEELIMAVRVVERRQ